MNPSSPNNGNQPMPQAQYPQQGYPPVPQPTAVPAGYSQPPMPPPQQPLQPPMPAAPGMAMPQQMPMQPQQPMMQMQAQPGMPGQAQVGVMPGAPGTAQPQVHPQTNPNSTQNTLQIAEIRDGIVIMNDGSFRSVLMLKSINFDLMSTAEKEGVEAGYQAFLNSLYFPLQIFIRSQKVDLQPYIERLDKIRAEHDNMLLAMLMEDYIGFMSSLSYQTNIMDKKFYVIIPYFPIADVQKAITQSKNFFTGLAGLFNKKENHVVINEPDLEQAKTELRNRVQAVLGGLMQCGVQGLPLDTQELIELYYDTYNPDTATRQQLKNFNDLNTPVVTKGQGMAPQPNLERNLQ